MIKKNIYIIIVCIILFSSGCRASDNRDEILPDEERVSELTLQENVKKDSMERISPDKQENSADIDIIEENVVLAEESSKKPPNDFDKKMAINVLQMNKDELLSEFGNDYEECIFEPDGGWQEGVIFDNGISVAFDNSAEKEVEWVELGGNTSYEGVSAGMTFIEVMKILGDAEIRQIVPGSNPTYQMTYEIQEHVRVSIGSYYENGTDSWITIH